MYSVQQKKQQQIQHFRQLKSLGLLGTILNDIETMAKGGDPDGVRDQFYPGFKDSDFQYILDAVR